MNIFFSTTAFLVMVLLTPVVMSAQNIPAASNDLRIHSTDKIVKYSNENTLIEKQVSVKNVEKFPPNNNSAVKNASDNLTPLDTMRVNTQILKTRVSDNLFDDSEKSKEIKLVEQ